MSALGSGFEVIARSNTVGTICAIQNSAQRLYGVQYHPEVDLSEYGDTVFRTFLFRIAGLKPTFTPVSREKAAIAYIQKCLNQFEKDVSVLCLVSGGVDSSVCVSLLRRVVPPERLFAVHVDSGFMRHQESDTVQRALAAVGVHLAVEHAGDIFYTALQGVTDPEKKRHIIGDTFMTVADAHIRRLGLNPEAVLLAQGTLRPDLIESGSRVASASHTADTIKTHHNDTFLARKLRRQGRIIEPLQDTRTKCDNWDSP